LQKVQTEVDESALSMLRSPQPAPIELILTTLINEIRAYEEGFDLILDDYHIIDARPIHSNIFARPPAAPYAPDYCRTLRPAAAPKSPA
jgi:hypothetical protein